MLVLHLLETNDYREGRRLIHAVPGNEAALCAIEAPEFWHRNVEFPLDGELFCVYKVVSDPCITVERLPVRFDNLAAAQLYAKQQYVFYTSEYKSYEEDEEDDDDDDDDDDDKDGNDNGNDKDGGGDDDDDVITIYNYPFIDEHRPPVDMPPNLVNHVGNNDNDFLEGIVVYIVIANPQHFEAHSMQAVDTW